MKVQFYLLTLFLGVVLTVHLAMNGMVGAAIGNPRVANALCASWADPQAALQVLEGLLMDRRGGRQGFPREVAGELVALRDHLVREMRLNPR